MAWCSYRCITRSSLSSIRSTIQSNAPKLRSTSSPLPFNSKPSSPLLRFSFSTRVSSELGCVASMLPLHDAVSAAARMTSTPRTCRALSQGTHRFVIQKVLEKISH